MNVKKEISKAKAMLVCLESLQNTKETMLNNGVEYEVMENFDEVICSQIKKLQYIVEDLAWKYSSKCSTEGFKKPQPKKPIEICSDRPKKDIYHTSIGDVCGSDEIINTFEKYKDE